MKSDRQLTTKDISGRDLVDKNRTESEAEGLSSSYSARAANRFGRLRGLRLFLRWIAVVMNDVGLANVG